MRTTPRVVLAFIPATLLFATACASSMPRGQAQVGWLIRVEPASTVTHDSSDRDVKSETPASGLAFDDARIRALDDRLDDDLERHFVLPEHVPAALSFRCVDPAGLPTCAATPAADDAALAPSKPDFVLTNQKAGDR